MKLARIIMREEVRQVCIGYHLYTRGDSKEYEHFLNGLFASDSNGTKEVSDNDIEIIARDIVDHSSRESFERFMEDTRYTVCVKEMVSILTNECCRTVVKEDKKNMYKLTDAFNGDKWKFDTVEELKKFADDYSEICEGDWMPVYRKLDQETEKYVLMTENEIKEAELPEGII